jgi:hypothetical protein
MRARLWLHIKRDAQIWGASLIIQIIWDARCFRRKRRRSHERVRLEAHLGWQARTWNIYPLHTRIRSHCLLTPDPKYYPLHIRIRSHCLLTPDPKFKSNILLSSQVWSSHRLYFPHRWFSYCLLLFLRSVQISLLLLLGRHHLSMESTNFIARWGRVWQNHLKMRDLSLKIISKDSLWGENTQTHHISIQYHILTVK